MLGMFSNYLSSFLSTTATKLHVLKGELNITTRSTFFWAKIHLGFLKKFCLFPYYWPFSEPIPYKVSSKNGILYYRISLAINFIYALAMLVSNSL